MLAFGDVTPDTPGFDHLCAESLAERHRMLERFATHWRDGSNRFAGPGERIIGARRAGELIGVCGRSRDPFDPHPRAGRIRHLYVAPVHRRAGTGRALVESILDDASLWFDYLNTNCPPVAASFYESLGFVVIAGDRITHRLALR